MTTVGFIGTGKASRASIADLLSDFLSPGDEIILPMSHQHMSDAVKTVADWALEQGVPLHVVVDDKPSKHFKAYEDKVTEILETDAVITDLVAEVEKLVIAWDDENVASTTALEEADARGIPAFDICRALERVEFVDEPEPVPAPAPTPAPAAKKETTPVDDETDPFEAEAQMPESSPMDDEEYRPYTRTELEAMDNEALKQILKDNDIPLPGPKPRASRMIDMILEAQGAEPDDTTPEQFDTALADGVPAEAVMTPEGVEQPFIPETEGGAFLPVSDAEAAFQDHLSYLAAIATSVDNLNDTINVRLANLTEMLGALGEVVLSGLQAQAEAAATVSERVDALDGSLQDIAQALKAAPSVNGSEPAATPGRRVLRRPVA